MSDFPYLLQINVSSGGVPKLPVQEAQVRFHGIEGDSHRNTVLHGGPDRALCVFSWERLQALQQEGHAIKAGSAGENLTLAGLDWAYIEPGDQIKIGEEVMIQITSFCAPCRQNAQWFQDKKFSRISQKTHPGWSRLYARVLSEGMVKPGDRVWIEPQSHRSVG